MAADADALAAFEAGGLTWRAESAHADGVRREVAERLAGLESVAGVSVLKRSLVRTVLRVPMQGLGHVIVKRYAVRGLSDRLKYVVAPSRALAEWRVGRALAAAGIPTAVPVAMGERRGAFLSDAALVTREIADALHLNAYVERHFRDAGDPRRAALYDELARTVRRMHDARFVHNDLHGGNLLVNGPPLAPRLFVIDLHSVRGPGRATDGARWFDLVKLLHSMLTCSTAAERERICRVYDETGGPSATRVGGLLSCGALSEELEPRLRRMELERVRSRTERALTRSSKFDISRAGPYAVHHLRSFPAGAVPTLVAAHRASLGEGGSGVLKDAERSALTRQRIDLPEGARTVIVKQYRCAALGERLKNAVRRPRAVSAWLAGNGLLVRRFDAAVPLALATRGGGIAMSEAFVVMEDLGEDARCDLVVLAKFAGALDAQGRREKRDLVTSAARLFRRLHEAGVYHGDLKAVNLFLRHGAGAPHIVLADYDRVEFDREVARRRRIKNLAQLSASVAICISLSDRLRFFREYARDDPEALADWKGWFRRVIGECRQKIVVRMKPIE